ncbi:MAG TPA: FGGY family carbohydrate kinase [Polyangiaceae bacterium]|nr:FGGY family carbohydrate kinase [Polyangiaceae bacterium]
MNDTPLLVAVDVSTTSLRAMIFDTLGRVIASGRAPLAVQTPAPLAYEQDAESWWSALALACRRALEEIPAERHGALTTLTIAHQRETIVLSDARGTPLAPALLWMDGRCAADVREAERRIGAVRLHALSGKPASTTPSLYKLMYLNRTHPELRDVACVHDVHSFLSLRLTGRAVSSLASADPTGLVDMRQKRWAESLLALVGIEPHQLPELVEVGYMIGPLLPSAAAELGLPEHVVVYAGAGDAQLAGLGAGVVDKSRAFVDLGTAVTCNVLTETYRIDQAFRTLHAAIPGKYALETTLRGGMQTIYWLIEKIMRSNSRAGTMLELESRAVGLRPGADGLVAVPYFAGVMNPYWNDQVGGSFLGLHHEHRPEHLYRALLEGIAFEERLHLEGVESATGRVLGELVLSGGGSRNALWCQILADVLGRRLHRVETLDATSLGAAILAAVAHGIYPSFEDATAEMCRHGRVFEPSEQRESYERLYRDVYRGLYHDVRTRMEALARLRGSDQTPPPASVRPV